MNDIPGAKTCSELHRLLRLFQSLWQRQALKERFQPWWLKGYLRSSVTQERLNHILLLHCLKPRTDSIDKSYSIFFYQCEWAKRTVFWEVMTIFVLIIFMFQETCCILNLCCPTTLHVSPPIWNCFLALIMAYVCKESSWYLWQTSFFKRYYIMSQEEALEL